MKVKIQGGWFEDSPKHAYFADSGEWIPSLTQVLKLTGLSDYSGIDEDVLQRAAERGTKVHELAATFNRYGDLDPSWVDEETQPYIEAYFAFLKETGFKPDPEWTEVPMIASIAGFLVGVTPDCHGILRANKCIIELKATASKQDSWSIQTAIQEASIYRSNRCGRVRRYSLMLMKDARYLLSDEYTNHEDDMECGIAALRCVWRRLRAGQKLWERV